MNDYHMYIYDRMIFKWNNVGRGRYNQDGHIQPCTTAGCLRPDSYYVRLYE